MKRICLSCGNPSNNENNNEPCKNCKEINWCQYQDIVETFEGKLGMVSKIKNHNNITIDIPFMGKKIVGFSDVRENLGRSV